MMSRVFLTLGLLPGKRWFRWLFRHRLPGFPYLITHGCDGLSGHEFGYQEETSWANWFNKKHIYMFLKCRVSSPIPPQVSFSESGSLGNSSGSDVTSLSSQLPDTPNSMVPSPIDTWWEGHPPRLPSSEQSPQWNPIEFVKEKEKKRQDRQKEKCPDGLRIQVSTGRAERTHWLDRWQLMMDLFFSAPSHPPPRFEPRCQRRKWPLLTLIPNTWSFSPSLSLSLGTWTLTLLTVCFYQEITR